MFKFHMMMVMMMIIVIILVLASVDLKNNLFFLGIKQLSGTKY